jgi:SAM-dependent methyltransferase
VSDLPEPERQRDLDSIRRTYDAYERQGRGRIWDTRNKGFARLVWDRDRAIVDLIRQGLPASGGRVLDVGFGDVRLANAVRDAELLVTDWIGVDVDSAAVQGASLAAPWAQFVESSADRMPFEDASFDVVLASALFSSLPSDRLEEAASEEITRLLKPAGWLVWYDLRYRNPMNPAVHGITRQRLNDLFPGWPSELRTTSLLPPLARRLGPATPWAYPLLERVPFLRSHVIGRLQRP